MQLPKTIESKSGEKLVFKGMFKKDGQDYLDVENFVAPGAGPPMHVHHRQEECLTVVTGKIGYKTDDGIEKFAGPGETVLFKAGVVHRFWNAGDTELHCTGYITPPDNIVYFLEQIWSSIDRNGGKMPNMIESAYLLTRYKSEFAMPEIPAFVQTFMFPVFIAIGKLTGKLKRYEGAPEAVK